MNTKTTQTKTAPKTATKPSAKSKAGKTCRSAPKAPQSATRTKEATREVLPSEALEQNAPLTIAADKFVSQNAQENSASAVGLAAMQLASGSEPLPASTIDGNKEQTDAAPTINGPINGTEVESRPAATSDSPALNGLSPEEQTPTMEEAHVQDAVITENADALDDAKSVQTIASNEEAPSQTAVRPAKKGKSPERRLREVNPRFAAACAEVSRLRTALIAELNTKSLLVGAPRRGEAVPQRTGEAAALTAQIKEARATLSDLIARRRQLVGATPELDAVTQKIRDINKQRKAARKLKKTIFAEEMAKQAPSGMESSDAVPMASREPVASNRSLDAPV